MRKERLQALANCRNIEERQDFEKAFFDEVYKCNEHELRFLIERIYLNQPAESYIKGSLGHIQDYVEVCME